MHLSAGDERFINDVEHKTFYRNQVAFILTCKNTTDTSIFRVGTVMYGEWISRTVNQSCLISVTPHIVQNNCTSSLPKES